MSLTELFVDVSGKAMSAMLVGIAFGEMLPPLALGYLTTQEHPSAFVIINLSLLIICCLCAGLFIHFGKNTHKSLAKQGDELAIISETKTIELELDFD